MAKFLPTFFPLKTQSSNFLCRSSSVFGTMYGWLGGISVPIWSIFDLTFSGLVMSFWLRSSGSSWLKLIVCRSSSWEAWPLLHPAVIMMVPRSPKNILLPGSMNTSCTRTAPKCDPTNGLTSRAPLNCVALVAMIRHLSHLCPLVPQNSPNGPRQSGPGSRKG